MRRPAFVVAAAVSAALVLAGGGPAQADTVVTFTPGAVWNDSAGNQLQLHGLGIVKSGATWYGFGENKTGQSSADTSFQSIPCYSSTDLAHWTYQKAALSRQSSGDLGPNRIVERPKVLYNAATSTYVMYLHIDNPSYSEAKVGVATSSTPCGAYSYRGSFQPLGQQSRDIGLFQDTDGSGYLLTEDRANGLRIDKLSADYLSVTSAVAVLAGYESPAMVKTGGRYYLLGSHLTGWNTNDNDYTTSTSLSSGWSPWRPVAPVGTNTFTSQTANIVAVGSSIFVYAGDRWTPGNLGTSPLVWLPLTLTGGTAALGWQSSWSLNLTNGSWTGATNPADGTYRLSSANSGLLLDAYGGGTTNGTGVIQWPATGGSNQQWQLHRVSGNTYTITGAGSGKCLEVPDFSPTIGTRLSIYSCNNGTNQRWIATATGTGRYALVNAASGWTADVVDGSKNPGAQLTQWVNNGGLNQQWSLLN